MSKLRDTCRKRIQLRRDGQPQRKTDRYGKLRWTTFHVASIAHLKSPPISLDVQEKEGDYHQSTARLLLQELLAVRSWVHGLPAAVAARKIRTSHPGLGPRVEVPHGILRITLGTTPDLLAEDVKVLVHGEGVAGVTSRDKVGHRARRDAQSAEHYKSHPTC